MCISSTLLNRAKSRTISALAGLALAASLSGTTTAHADVDLVFGTYTADKATETVNAFKPVLNHIAQQMSDVMDEPVNVRLKITNQYDLGIEQLATGKVDFSRFGPASYVTAKEMNAGIEIVAMELVDGMKTFKGIIAVHQDSEISTLADLKGRSFAFGDELSTIGRYLAQQQLLTVGISAENLSSYEFLGRHDRVGTAVGAGDYDAGALKSSTFENLKSKGVPIRALASFDNVTKPWIVRAGLDIRIVDAMRQVLTDPKNADALKSASKHGFTDGTDQDYDIIRDAMKTSLAFGG
jgi:phosphonate transport system substrate-binding protein